MNHILHLRVNTKNIIKESNKDFPLPYNSFINNKMELKINNNNNDTNFFSINKELKLKTKNFKENYNNNYITRKIYDTFLSLNKTIDNKVWPINTSIHCMWCVHQFDTVPCGIPKKYKNNKFECYGCFCSFNCAASFLFDKKDYNMWEEYNLLNFLYRKLFENNTKKIKLAPNRLILKIFGGILSIDEFRNNSLDINTSYLIHTPPMTTIISKIEEIKNTDNSSFIPINKNLFLKAESLKHNIDNDNIVGDFMNLTIMK